MKARFLIIIAISASVFLTGTVVYPYINEITSDDNYPNDIKIALEEDNNSSILNQIFLNDIIYPYSKTQRQ